MVPLEILQKDCTELLTPVPIGIIFIAMDNIFDQFLIAVASRPDMAISLRRDGNGWRVEVHQDNPTDWTMPRLIAGCTARTRRDAIRAALDEVFTPDELYCRCTPNDDIDVDRCAPEDCPYHAWNMKEES